MSVPTNTTTSIVSGVHRTGLLRVTATAAGGGAGLAEICVSRDSGRVLDTKTVPFVLIAISAIACCGSAAAFDDAKSQAFATCPWPFDMQVWMTAALIGLSSK